MFLQGKYLSIFFLINEQVIHYCNFLSNFPIKEDIKLYKIDKDLPLSLYKSRIPLRKESKLILRHLDRMSTGITLDRGNYREIVQHCMMCNFIHLHCRLSNYLNKESINLIIYFTINHQDRCQNRKLCINNFHYCKHCNCLVRY